MQVYLQMKNGARFRPLKLFEKNVGGEWCEILSPKKALIDSTARFSEKSIDRLKELKQDREESGTVKQESTPPPLVLSSAYRYFNYISKNTVSGWFFL
jgi:hypothetical protein